MIRPLKVFIIAATILITTGSLLLLQKRLDKVQSRVTEIKPLFKRNSSVKTILYWTPMFSRKDFYFGTGSAIFEKCAYSNCFATYDKNYLPIDEFDALAFHGVEYKEKSYGKPSKRNPKQVYIFGCLESPIYSNNYMKETNNFYNWTMTYRLDSDILRPYGRVQKQKTDYRAPSIEEIEKRPKKIAWFVSRCNAQSKRMLLHDELNKFIPVDVYGKCGNLSCTRDKGADCYKMLEQNYKFYLAFENSLCEEYATEKLYKALTRNVVPIVYGGANYTTITPPNSVINVMDFNSILDLINFINYLDEHTEAYLRFFEWKRDYVVTDSQEKVEKKTLCDLCQKLNEPIQSQTYGDIAEWWQGKDFYKKCQETKLERMFS